MHGSLVFIFQVQTILRDSVMWFCKQPFHLLAALSLEVVTVNDIPLYRDRFVSLPLSLSRSLSSTRRNV